MGKRSLRFSSTANAPENAGCNDADELCQRWAEGAPENEQRIYEWSQLYLVEV